MSLPAYLAPTASTRSKYQPRRTAIIKQESSSLVKRTSSSIKELVNAATRSHHGHGAEHSQHHYIQSKRQPISSSHTTPMTATTITTTTTPGRSSLESGESLAAKLLPDSFAAPRGERGPVVVEFDRRLLAWLACLHEFSGQPRFRSNLCLHRHRRQRRQRTRLIHPLHFV